MLTVRNLLFLSLFETGIFYAYPSGLLQWLWCNQSINNDCPVPVKNPEWNDIVYNSHEFTNMADAAQKCDNATRIFDGISLIQLIKFSFTHILYVYLWFGVAQTCHFYPRPVLTFGYCRCLLLFVYMYACVYVSLCAITHEPVEARVTKFGPKDLGYGPIVKGESILTFKVKLTLKYKIYPILSLKYVCAITHHPFNLGSSHFDLVKIIIVVGSHLYTVSPSRTFHSVNPLHVYWSRQPRVTRRLALLLFSGHQIWQDIHWKVKSCDYANHAMAPTKTSDIPTEDKLSPWQLSVFTDCSKTSFT